MNSDATQQQSLNGLAHSEQLSLQTTIPPAKIEGYRIDKLLGQGAFGQVWQGHDLNTGRQVAIKFYLHRQGVDWSLINREVKHLVNMSTGRYIVQILSVGWKAEPPYYVMEYLENGSLEDMVRSQGSLSVSAASKMLQEIAEGLSYAHEKGVLHCDLKPANIMLDHDLRPRLADFGQSRMTNEQTPSLGTLFFMAPEQADLNAQPSAAWDIYALGAIAYCMLVGSPPYRTPEIIETLDTANSLTERLKRYRDTIRFADRPRLHYRRRGIDRSLCLIIDRCLAPNPENRYGNVQQVIAALDTRARARIRRPLYFLGVLGPILLLLLIMFFSARSINLAKKESIQSVQQWAVRSNKDTAMVAAQFLEGEIAGLFRMVEDEAERKELRNLVWQVVQDGRPLLSVLADGKSHPQEREQLVGLESQSQLSEHLSTRLSTLAQDADVGSTIFNTVFVTDSRGTHIGIHFANPEEQRATSPLGRNYAYRTYFNGQPSDGKKSDPSENFSPIRYTHLSSAFRSTATLKWKVGISTPIWHPDVDEDRRDQTPIGVLVVTINLGNFELLAGSSESQLERFASLIDGRPGNERGALLHHPFLKEIEQSGELRNAPVPQIDPRILERLVTDGGIIDYRDPSADFAEDPKFSGTWIAALKPVRLPRRVGSNREDTTNLWVLVQERSSSVAKPVEDLGSKLQRETYLELAALLSVMCGLWFFVLRPGKSWTRGTPQTKGNESTYASFPSTIDSDDKQR
ncbi:MAG: protein kinase [bacterium]|nr:protein kinase [bacterium]